MQFAYDIVCLVDDIKECINDKLELWKNTENPKVRSRVGGKLNM